MLTNTPYILPKDQAETDRLDFQHYLLRFVAGGNYRAPIRQPRAILDVACGTGIWGREMAQQFPRARVVGFDIDRGPLDRSLKIPGPGGQFPANFRFQTADALKPFPFQNETFDFAHARFIATFVPIDRWPHVVGEMMRVLKGGGAIEIVDMERPPTNSSPAYRQLSKIGTQLMIERNLYIGVEDHLVKHLSQAGAQHIQQRKFTIGTGPQGQQQQQLLADDLFAAIEHLKGIITRQGLLSVEVYESLVEQARQEVPQMSITMPIVFAFGTKL
jgi:ubiquinone/menaquinone biosynthesis C-methylase UbiE